jgi:hypothetical protein
MTMTVSGSCLSATSTLAASKNGCRLDWMIGATVNDGCESAGTERALSGSLA